MSELELTQGDPGPVGTRFVHERLRLEKDKSLVETKKTSMMCTSHKGTQKQWRFLALEKGGGPRMEPIIFSLKIGEKPLKSRGMDPKGGGGEHLHA